jgi:formate/nitrite transporter
MGFKKPGEIVEAACTISQVKTETDPRKLLVLGFLAGAYIAFGCTVGICTGKCITAPELAGLSKLLFGGTFALGPILVVIAGAEMFAANLALVPPGCYKGVSKWSRLAQNWALVFLGNFVGGLFVAYLCYAGGIFAQEPLLSAVRGIADSKVSLTFAQAFWRGVGSNWLLCLGIWLATAAEDVAGKVLSIWFPMMAFVAIGFEQCVANFYFIPVGILHGATRATWVNMFTVNLMPVVPGNIIGGAFFVATIYWCLYGKKD